MVSIKTHREYPLKRRERSSLQCKEEGYRTQRRVVISLWQNTQKRDQCKRRGYLFRNHAEGIYNMKRLSIQKPYRGF